MPKLAITDIAVNSLRTPGVYMDEKLPAFGIRVGKNRKAWLVVPDQRRVRKVIGHYPAMGVAKARNEARMLLATRSQFHEVRMDEALTTFLELHKTKTRPSTHYSVRRHLNTYILPKLGTRSLADVKAHEVMKLVEAIEYPAEAAKTFHITKQFWRWASARGHCTHVLMQLGPPSHSPQRERVLTDEELGRIWACTTSPNGTSKLPATYCAIVKLLILTGQRRGEIAGLQTPWIKHDRINLPKEIVKNHRAHTFPIATLASEILAQAKKARRRDTEHLFLDLSKLFCDWSRCKKLLDKASGVTGWTLHDCRRTFSSSLSALGVRTEIIERLLNHHSGTFRGVAGTYNRYDFFPEMKAAIELWEQRLTAIVQRT